MIEDKQTNTSDSLKSSNSKDMEQPIILKYDLHRKSEMEKLVIISNNWRAKLSWTITFDR